MTDLKPARPELLALAAAVRDPGWADQLDGALTAAAVSPGWDWARAGWYAARLIFTPDSHPREMLAEVRGPLECAKPAPSEVAEAALAEMRAAVSAASPWRQDRAEEAGLAREQAERSRQERHADLDGVL